MFEYNTQMKRLVLPEYGRNVQRMVDYCLTIEDREERTRCAYAIVATMGNLFPHLRDIDEFKHKLWDHLAIMSDFQLDIDYPVEVVKRESLEVKPDRLSYPQKNIRFRHYGRFIEDLAKTAADMPDGEEKQRLLFLVASHMKRDYLNWNKDSVEDQKIFDDLSLLADGKVQLSTADFRLAEQRPFIPRKKQMGGSQKKKY